MATDLLSTFNTFLKEQQQLMSGKQPRSLYEPGAYILGLGGKRVRPVAVLMGAAVFGGDPQRALNAALSVEYFHNFSLIHDDILDNAPLRRNHPTVHEKWNRDIAILSGDVLLIQSLQLLNHYEPAVSHRLSQLLHHTAIEVCEGQQLDMDYEKQEDVGVDDYLRMIELKTAVLLGCSFRMGAICAGASDSDGDRIYQFGTGLGIAFQLLDDYLDAFSDGSNFGKVVGGDIVAGKKTYLALHAMEKASAAQKKQLKELLSDRSQPAEERVRQTVALFRDLGSDQQCLAAATHYTTQAMTSVSQLSVSPDKRKLLQTFAEQLLQRRS